LVKLDLHYHFLTPAMQEKLTRKFPQVDLSDVQEGDEYKGEIHRYVSVGE